MLIEYKAPVRAVNDRDQAWTWPGQGIRGGSYEKRRAELQVLGPDMCDAFSPRFVAHARFCYFSAVLVSESQLYAKISP